MNFKKLLHVLPFLLVIGFLFFILVYVVVITVLFIFYINTVYIKPLNLSKMCSDLKIIKFLQEQYIIFLEDDIKFKKYYKKNLPNLYYLLRFVRIISPLFFLYYSKLVCADYSSILMSTLNLEPISAERQESYQKNLNFLLISYYVCLSTILLIFILDTYVIFKANSPLKHRVSKVAVQGLQVVSGLTVLTVGYIYSPTEPNFASHFMHTKTPLGRGYDYDLGSISNRFKGDIISGGLGRKIMLEAVEKYAPDSKILSPNILTNILNDKEYAKQLSKNLSLAEKQLWVSH